MTLSNKNGFSAAALAAALLLAPYAPLQSSSVHAATPIVSPTQQPQDGDSPSEAEQAMFNRGQSLYNQGRYDQAISVLQDFLKTYPQSSITDLTLLWLGRSYMESGRIPEAEQVGRRLSAMKDNPFTEIYDTELQKARRDYIARNGATTSTVAPSTASSPLSSSAAPSNSANQTSKNVASTAAPTSAKSSTPNNTSIRSDVSGTSRSNQATDATTAIPSATRSNANSSPSSGRSDQSAANAATNVNTSNSNTPRARLITATPPLIASASTTPPSTTSSSNTAASTTTSSAATQTETSPSPAPTNARRNNQVTRRASAAPNRSALSREPQSAPTSTSTQARASVDNQSRATPVAATPSGTAATNSQLASNDSSRRNAASSASRNSAPPISANTTSAASTNANTTNATRSAVLASSNNTASNSSSAPTETASAPAQGGLTLTVKQVPSLALALKRTSETASPGQNIQLPLTVTNTGNKEDQFRLETDLPAEYQPTFSLAAGGAADMGLPILVTPQLARGASVDVLLNLRVPETSADGQQRRFFVRAASGADYKVTRVVDGSISVVAAALAATSNVAQSSVMPGETFGQTITVRNSGSANARLARANFVFNPDFDLVNASPAPTVYDRASHTAVWILGDLKAREARDINVTLRASADALAATNSLGRGTVSTPSLPVGANFDSPSITVGKLARARVDAVSVGLTATPGDTVYVPFVVRNPGNAIDSYELKLTAPAAPPATIYADTNGDGQHQENEPAITQTAPIAPQGGQYPLLLRVQIPSGTPDRQQYAYNLVARSQTSARAASEARTVLTVALPGVRVRTEQVADSSAPGDTIYYRLVLVNEGSGLAKNLIVEETLPDALQLVSSEPTLNAADASNSTQRFTWRVAQLAPGDTTVLRIAVRLRSNLQAGTDLTTRHTLTYQDANGNNHTGR